MGQTLSLLGQTICPGLRTVCLKRLRGCILCKLTLDVATSSLMEEEGEGTSPTVVRRYEWQRERRRPVVPQSRIKPPTQDRLVLVFISAAALFTFVTISPFLFGDFASSHYSHDRNASKRRMIPIQHDADSHFGVGNLLSLAENRTHLTWQYLTELKKRKQHLGGSMGGGIVDLHLAPWENGGEEEEEFPQQQQQHQQSSSSINGRGYISIIGDNAQQVSLRLDRGVSGLPLSKTPALVGAHHGTIQCPEDDVTNHNINELAYWNDPQGTVDASFISPFDPRNKNNNDMDDGLTRYVTFEPDRGGWNNIRMSLEIVIVFAAVTGRTLVLPPDTPFYLLSKDGSDAKSGPNGNSRTGKKRHHGFADFLDLDHGALREKLNMISMTEFLEKEGGGGGGVVADTLFEIPNGIEGTKIMLAAEQCYYITKSDRPCDAVYDFLRSNAYVPDIQAGRDCLIFDTDHIGVEDISELPTETQAKIADFCGRNKRDARNPILFGGELATSRLVHFHAGEKYHRLLNHFYTFLFFSDVKMDHHYKRFVRDFLHYPDSIFCAAGRVIKLLEEESTKLLIHSSDGGGPSYSSMHVRRGDFQYKKVKITAQDWYDNTKELFSDGELIFVATDEKSKKFFEPLQKHYNLRFLHDYTHAAGLNEMDPNLMGMIDSIVASRGRLFVGTWFSTFTGYINRMRGYYGYPGSTSYYSTHDRKFNTHQWENPEKVLTAREWPTAWIGIDGDEDVNVEREP